MSIIFQLKKKSRISVAYRLSVSVPLYRIGYRIGKKKTYRSDSNTYAAFPLKTIYRAQLEKKCLGGHGNAN